MKFTITVECNLPHGNTGIFFLVRRANSFCKDPKRPGNSMNDYSLSKVDAATQFSGDPTKATEFWTEMIETRHLRLPIGISPQSVPWRVRVRLESTPPFMIGQNRRHE